MVVVCAGLGFLRHVHVVSLLLADTGTSLRDFLDIRQVALSRPLLYDDSNAESCAGDRGQ